MIRLTLLALAAVTVISAAPAYAKPVNSNDVINACTRQSDCKMQVNGDGSIFGETDSSTFICNPPQGQSGNNALCNTAPKKKGQ